MILPDWPMVRITRRKEMVQGGGINAAATEDLLRHVSQDRSAVGQEVFEFPGLLQFDPGTVPMAIMHVFHSRMASVHHQTDLIPEDGLVLRLFLPRAEGHQGHIQLRGGNLPLQHGAVMLRDVDLYAGIVPPEPVQHRRDQKAAPEAAEPTNNEFRNGLPIRCWHSPPVSLLRSY